MTLCASLRLVIIVVLVVLPRSFPFVSQIIMPLPLRRRLRFYVPSYVSSYVPSYVPSYGPLFVPSSIEPSSTMALYSSSSSPSPSSPPPPPPSPSSTLTVATYNILSTSLASPASPWLLTLPECLDPTGEVKKAIEREYFQGWHKNKEAGNWKRFRKLFGSQDLTLVQFHRMNVTAHATSPGSCVVAGSPHPPLSPPLPHPPLVVLRLRNLPLRPPALTQERLLLVLRPRVADPLLPFDHVQPSVASVPFPSPLPDSPR